MNFIQCTFDDGFIKGYPGPLRPHPFATIRTLIWALRHSNTPKLNLMIPLTFLIHTLKTSHIFTDQYEKYWRVDRLIPISP